jgi:hypothetical protein
MLSLAVAVHSNQVSLKKDILKIQIKNALSAEFSINISVEVVMSREERGVV